LNNIKQTVLDISAISVDEGSYYLNRAMKVLNGEGPQYGDMTIHISGSSFWLAYLE
jgi:hypothetical protein